MIRWIKRQIYKCFYYAPVSQQRIHGKFKVYYPDVDQYSRPMNYGSAKVYAGIFEGKVVDNF